MYSTCLFCNRPLGTNEAIEEFPVGRRLAYDAARGRLWVVCRRCERWNLSPLETRWEAIEECERRFRDTRLRVSTDNIGLAKLSEGLELVRVGEPQRPEFAAWRYGDQFGRRRKRAIAYSAAGAAGLGLVVVGGAAAGISIGGGWGLIGVYQNWLNERTVARVRDLEGNPIRVQTKHLLESRIVPASGSEGWGLELAHVPGWDKGSTKEKQMESLLLEGDSAVRVAGQLMARVNRRGGKRDEVQTAVSQIEESGNPEAYLREAAHVSSHLRDRGAEALEAKRRRRRSRARHTRKGSLGALPTEMKLAVEMATQEQAEREAMEGELAVLEAAWQAAEEIASIADNLLVPKSAEEFIRLEKESLTDNAASSG